jgi:transcriptional regulator of acetoin/glycerol metabolism
MIDNTINNNIDKLYNLFEVKLEFIADSLLMSKTNNNDNILMSVQTVIEKVFLISAMKISNNNISKAAKLLGINRNTLSKKLKELKAATHV